MSSTYVFRSQADLTAFGQRVLERRMAKGMSQEQLAEGMLTVSIVAQIEAGQALPSSLTLAHLAKRLGTTMDLLCKNETHNELHLSAYTFALSQMEVDLYHSALVTLENLSRVECLHPEIPQDELMLNLAVCYARTERDEEAAQTLDVLVKRLAEQAGSSQAHSRLAVTAHLELSQACLRMNRYFDALYHATRARDEHNKSGSHDPSVRGRILVHLASVYTEIHWYDDAKECYQQALNLYSGLGGDLTEVGVIYQRLAEICHHQDNPALTIEFANKAILSLQASRMVIEYREAKRLIVVHQVNSDNWRDSADVLLHLAASYGSADVTKVAKLYLDVAEIYLRHGRGRANGFHYAQQAIELLEEQQIDSELIGRAHLVLGSLYQQRNNLSEAQRSLEQAAAIYQHLECLNDLQKVAHQLAALYVANDDHQKALEIHETTHGFIVNKLRHRGVAL